MKKPPEGGFVFLGGPGLNRTEAEDVESYLLIIT
jgi:hypothetical protein